ncbi:MAG: helix-turn-helix domain-containing protein, partial [Lachnospiraceae bacterium]
ISKGNDMNLGENLRELRTLKGLKQSSITTVLNISQSAYSLYELGKREPTFDTLIKIAEFFDVSTDYLLGLSTSTAHSVSSTNLKPLFSDEELEVLEYYRALDKTNQRWIVGQMIDLDKKAKETDILNLEPKQA